MVVPCPAPGDGCAIPHGYDSDMTDQTGSEPFVGLPGSTHRSSLILTIWAEPQRGRPQVWRGYVETAHARRFYFSSLASLTDLLVKLGWQDPPAQNALDAPEPEMRE